jgi:hypothetical protein
MPRRKKPDPNMTDSELLESLFPKPVRKLIERELEAECDPEEPVKHDESRAIPSIERKDR